MHSLFTRLHNYQREETDTETALEDEIRRQMFRQQYERNVRYKVKNYVSDLGKRG